MDDANYYIFAGFGFLNYFFANGGPAFCIYVVLRMKKNLLAVFFGFVLVGLVFGGVELFYRFFVPVKAPSFYAPPFFYVHSPEALISEEMLTQIKNDPIMAWKSRRSIADSERFFFEGLDISEKGKVGCCVIKGRFAAPGRIRSRVYSLQRDLLYDVQFTFDEYSRRITPLAPQARKALLALGDSYTLGEGVDDEHSFPWFLGTYRPGTQVYNLGISGGGPNSTLYEVSKLADRRLPDLRGQEVTALYTFMSDHMDRLFCPSSCLQPHGKWKLSLPFYSLQDGKPHFEGSFATRTRLNEFYSWFNKSAFVQRNGIVLPPQFTQAHFDFFATMMVEIRDTLKAQYPSLNFYVAMYPGNSFPYGNEVTTACRKKGLRVLNYANVDVGSLSQNREKIAGDGHPSPIAQMIFARLLDRDLPR